jgi:hypothetical protein
MKRRIYMAGCYVLAFFFWLALCVLGVWDWLHPEVDEGRSPGDSKP